MTTINLKILFLIFFLSYTSASASTVLNLVCDQYEFSSRNQHISKSLGHSFADGRRFFQLAFDEYNQSLETDMSMVIDSKIVSFKNKNNIIKITTTVDNVKYFHMFEINRFTGKLKHIRAHYEDTNRLEVNLHDCKSAQRKF